MLGDDVAAAGRGAERTVLGDDVTAAGRGAERTMLGDDVAATGRGAKRTMLGDDVTATGRGAKRTVLRWLYIRLQVAMCNHADAERKNKYRQNCSTYHSVTAFLMCRIRYL